MTTIINNTSRVADEGYNTYQKPDTKIPPKPKSLFQEVSVNGVKIREADILAEAQNHQADRPGEALMEAAKALVIRELLWQEAKQSKTNSLPKLDGSGQKETRKDAAIRALIDREVHVPEASDAECKRFYDNNPDRCKSEDIFEARHILIAVKDGEKSDWDRASKIAEEIISTLSLNPSEFGKIARELSMCPSKSNGGNLGQVTAGNTVPEFEKALRDMKVGTISRAPVRSRYGFHIIALDRKIEGAVLPFETIKERLRAWLEAASWSKAVAQYLSILVGKSKVTGIDLTGADSPLIQ